MDGSTFVILKSLLNRAEGDVSDILALLGTTDISSIGDGTVTGAIDDLKDLIDLLPKFDIEVVQTLPTSDISETTIYLVPAQKTGSRDLYSEYIYVNNTWAIVRKNNINALFFILPSLFKYTLTVTKLICCTFVMQHLIYH